MANSEPPPNPPKGPGWIEKLAQRSTGLGDQKPADDSPKPSENKRLGQLGKVSGLGLQFGFTVAIFWFIGQAIDRHMHWHLAATLTCLIIAVMGSTYLLIKEAIKANQDPDNK